MDTGQIPMMLVPTGTTAPVATPAISTATVAQAGDQKSGDGFAALLSGVSSLVSSQQAVTASPAKTGSPMVSGVTGEETVAPQTAAKPDDMLAMLLAAVGSGSQLTPPVANTVKDTAKEPAESKQPEAAQPQDVALYAAGTLGVLPAQLTGRMPETGEIGQVADDTVTTMPAIGAITVPGEMAPQQNAKGQADISFTQKLNTSDVPDWPTDNGVSGAQEVQMPAQVQQQAAPSQATPLHAESQQATSQPVPAVQTTAAPQAVAAQTASPQALPVETVSQPAGALTEEPMPFQVVSMGLESTRQIVAVQPEAKPAAPQSADNAADVPSAAATAQSDIASKPSSPALPGEATLLSQASPAPAHAATGTLTEVDTNTPPVVSEMNPGQRVDETGGEAAKPREVAVPHSSSPGVALAGTQQYADHAPEKPLSMVENNVKASVVQQLAKANEGGTDTGSGTSGEKPEGFMPKVSEAPAGATQQITGHQALFTQALGSVASQPVQTDASGPVSHEQVAGQVREQLSNHDLKPGSDQITFKLSPDHLGDIKVNLSLEDQRLKVEIVAENKTARDSLLQHVDSLKESLSRQNISVEKFDVTTGGGSTGSNGNNAQGEWRELAKNRQSQQWLSTGGYRSPQVETVSSLPMYQARTEHAMVDLHF